MNDFRVGIGQDSHKFSNNPDKKLFLGGIEIKDEPGLESNSDGDPIMHSVCNALEQAIGNDSFSTYADEMCENGITDSKEYLKYALNHIKDKGYRINNIGISIEAKRPKILPVTNDIRKSIADILKIDESSIGINSTSGEDITCFGKGEGIQAFAIVSLVK